jgi:hypothetical protein
MPKPNVMEPIARAINPSAWSLDLDSVDSAQPWKMSVICGRKDSPELPLRVLDSIRQADRDMVGRQIIPAPSIPNHCGLSQNASRNPYEARGRPHCAIAKEQPTARVPPASNFRRSASS